eukprot:gene27094-2318_t
MLERERAAVLAFGIEQLETQALSGNNRGGQRDGYPPYPPQGGYQEPYQNPHQGPHQNPHQGRNRMDPGPGPVRRNGKQPPRAHNFLNAQKKVFDPNDIPGLGGSRRQGPKAPPPYLREASMAWPNNVLGHPQTPRDEQNQMGMSNTFPDSPGFYPGMVFGIPEEGQRGGSPGRGGPGAGMQSAMWSKGPPQAQQTTPQEVYRRELEEQIQAKNARKASEAEALRREDERLQRQWQAKGQKGRGGGGEPIMSPTGHPMADLRNNMHHPHGDPYGPHQGQGQYNEPPPQQGEHTWGNQHGHGNMKNARTSHTALTVEVPNPYSYGEGGPPYRVSGGGGPAPNNASPGPFQAGGAQRSPGHGKYVSDLRAGPSDDQRGAAEVARQKLQDDLKDQIREKKAREARERAVEEAAIRKEEAEFQAYFQLQKDQRDVEVAVQRQRMAAKEEGENIPRTPPGVGMPGHGGLSPGGPAASSVPAAAPPRRRRGGGKIIDAPWLDAIAKPGNQQLPVEEEVVAGFGGARYRRSTLNGDDGPHDGNAYNGGGPHHHDGGFQDGAGVKTLLSELKQEQIRMREEFFLQAEAVEKLATNAARAMQDRDQAWKELNRVRDSLDQGFSPSDALDQFVVETHLISRQLNDIPSRLATPLMVEYGSHGEGESYSPHGLPRHKPPLPTIFDDEEALDSLDKLLKCAPMHAHGYDVHHGKKEPEYERGLYRPVSDVPGRPSQIPKAPLANRSGAGVPKSRVNSFFGLEDGSVPAAQARGGIPKPAVKREVGYALPGGGDRAGRNANKGRGGPVAANANKGARRVLGPALTMQEQHMQKMVSGADQRREIPSAPTGSESLAKLLGNVKAHLGPSAASLPEESIGDLLRGAKFSE